jgi:hypothetical protein
MLRQASQLLRVDGPALRVCLVAWVTLELLSHSQVRQVDLIHVELRFLHVFGSPGLLRHVYKNKSNRVPQ